MPLLFTVTKQNTPWLAEKIADNRRRDARRTAELKDRGWNVIRMWEHEVQAKAAHATAARIAKTVRRQEYQRTH